jgi:hypothetical protein
MLQAQLTVVIIDIRRPRTAVGKSSYQLTIKVNSLIYTDIINEKMQPGPTSNPNINKIMAMKRKNLFK